MDRDKSYQGGKQREEKKAGYRMKKRENIFHRLAFFLMMIACMMLASGQPKLGGANGTFKNIYIRIDRFANPYKQKRNVDVNVFRKRWNFSFF